MWKVINIVNKENAYETSLILLTGMYKYLDCCI